MESVLVSAFNINITVNNSALGQLVKKTPLSYSPTNCNEQLLIQVNDKQLTTSLDNSSKYYKISKATGGVGIQVSLGGRSMVEIEDCEPSRLLLLQRQ
jgi:hypothetical protein